MDKNDIAKKAVMLIIAIGVSVAATAIAKTASTLLTDNFIAPVVNDAVDKIIPVA